MTRHVLKVDIWRRAHGLSPGEVETLLRANAPELSDLQIAGFVRKSKHAISDQVLALIGRFHKRAIPRWRRGESAPLLETVQRFAVLTDGFVGLMDWPTPYTEELRAEQEKALRRARLKAARLKAAATAGDRRRAARGGKGTP